MGGSYESKNSDSQTKNVIVYNYRWNIETADGSAVGKTVNWQFWHWRRHHVDIKILKILFQMRHEHGGDIMKLFRGRYSTYTSAVSAISLQ